MMAGRPRLRATPAALLALAVVTNAYSPGGVPTPRTRLPDSPAMYLPDGPSKPGLDDQTRIGNLKVPQLALGTIAWVPKNPADAERIAHTARVARELGLDFVDTAERYGASGASLIPAALSAIGRALGLPIKEAYTGGDCESNLAQWGAGSTVGTKFTPTPWRRSAQDVVDACEASAKRLGVESLDLYQIHMPDIIQPLRAFGYVDVADEAYWDGLAECYHRGLARNVGVSNYGPTLVAKAHAALAKRGVPLASNQIHFSLLYRQQGSLATVQRCRELGVQVLAYYPLAMGLLTGELDADALREKGDSRSQDLLRYLEGGVGGTAGRVPDGGVAPLVDTLRAVATRIGKTPAQVALNWVICKGAIPIAGASKPSHVESNAGALGWRLGSAEIAELDAAADALDFEFNGCGFQPGSAKFVGYGFEEWRLD